MYPGALNRKQVSLNPNTLSDFNAPGYKAMSGAACVKSSQLIFQASVC